MWDPTVSAPPMSTSSAPLPAVIDETEQTAATPQKNQIPSNPVQKEAPSLPPHLLGVSLSEVAEKGDIEAVKALLNAKADINAQSGGGVNALLAATMMGHEAVVRL